MTQPIGTDDYVSRGTPSIHQNTRGNYAQGTYRRNLVSCRGIAHVDVAPSPAGPGVRGC